MPHAFKGGDMVGVMEVPPGLHEEAGIGTPDVFASAVGLVFRIDGFDEYGHLELFVRQSGSGSDS